MRTDGREGGKLKYGKVEVPPLFHFYNVVVLLAFLGEDILAVEDGLCADLGIDI